MKSIVTTILRRFQNQGKSQGKSRTVNPQEGVQTTPETVENQTIRQGEGRESPTTPEAVNEHQTTTLAVEDGTPGPTGAAEAIKAQVVQEGKATGAAEAIKAQVVQEGKATVVAGAIKALVVQGIAEMKSVDSTREDDASAYGDADSSVIGSSVSCPAINNESPIMPVWATSRTTCQKSA